MTTKLNNTPMDSYEYVQERGFYYSLDQIYNFYVQSLKLLQQLLKLLSWFKRSILKKTF